MAAIRLPTDTTLAVLAVVGIVAGLFLLARGFSGFLAGRRVSGTSTSRISALAVGEVLVSGAAEPVELTLVSPLQSAPCLYYRARVRESSDGDGRDLFAEERAVGFRVRDASGTVRVFPRGARFDVPNCYDESSGSWDGDPPGLLPRTGSAFGPGPDRESQIAALLTVRDPGHDPWARASSSGGAMVLGLGSRLGASTGRRHYQEARIEPGDLVTVIGQVLPFSELDDPASANLDDGSTDPTTDPEIAADLAAARSSGMLADTPAEAWGNAAIEGFGIGRPVRQPVLDPAATPPPPPDPSIAARAAAAFEIAAGDLVIAASDQVPLIVSIGAPAETIARSQLRFVVGLLGAVLAIASGMALALVLDGTIR
jgi:hypothetical protein